MKEQVIISVNKYFLIFNEKLILNNKNWREFWIDGNISKVTYQKNRFLKIIYLYSDPNSVSVRSDYVSDAKFNPRGMHHVYAITHTFLDLIQRTKLLPDSLNATAVLHTPQNQVFFSYIIYVDWATMI